MSGLSEALRGTRVLDFSQGIAGPHAACLLVEMGADVVKIEPPAGDWVRALGVRKDGSSVLFGTFNRGKRGLRLDLKQPRAREAALRLAARADVMFESNRPGVAARLGLDHESVRAMNPRLVYVSVSGYGQTGPYANRPASDAALQAYTGLAFGVSDMVDPFRLRIALADVVTGIYASHAVLAALLQRTRTGEGKYLDISLMHGITAVQAYRYAEYVATGGAPPNDLIASAGFYRTKDGFIAHAPMREQQVIDLLKLLGLDSLLQDDRFATPAARLQNLEALRPFIAERLLQKPTQHWVPLMEERNLVFQEVLHYGAYMRDPQVAARQLFQMTDFGAVGVLPAVRMPGLHVEGPTPAPAPALGEHSKAVLREAGLDDADIEALTEEPLRPPS